jgi:hypothetical protein
MVTFVMCGSMGQGDFFDTIVRMFGGRRKAEVVATLYGKDVTFKEINELRIQRRLANQYMDAMSGTAGLRAIQAALQASNTWQERQRQTVEDSLRTVQGVDVRLFQIPQFREFYMDRVKMAFNALERLRAEFRQAKKDDDAKLIDGLSTALGHEIGRMRRERSQLYFGGTISLDDILDFMIWRHEADRRGIQITRQDMTDLVFEETGQLGVTRADQKNIEEDLRRSHQFTPESLRTALADEFRVRIAKTALLGNDQRFSGYPTTWATPYEFWQFYKENRTESTLAVLPIPVRNKDFLAQVGQPSEKDLKELFEKYKDQEYHAGSPEPGFKIPPRIEVEWISARADSEHYRREAARTAALIQAGFQVLAGSVQTMSGSVAADATAATLPLAFDLNQINQYELERYRLRNASWTEEWNKFFNPRLHESSFRRANNIAATLGQAFGATGTQAPALSSYLTYAGTAGLREAHDRAGLGTTMIGTSLALAPTSPAPLMSAALVQYASPQPLFIPLSEVKDRLAEKSQEELAQKLVQRDLGDLQKQLETGSKETPDRLLMSRAVNRPEVIAATLGQAFGSTGTGAPLALTAPLTLGPPAINHYVQARAREALVTTLAGPNPYPFLTSGLAPLIKVRKAIDQAVKSYGFEHGSTRKPEDRFTIGDDEGLKPLKEVYQHSPFGERQGKDFANLFFQNLSGSYSPQQYPQGDSTNPFLYWKTMDKPAYVPTFAEVQDKVKEWWQLDKARELAKKEAEDLMAKAKGQPDAQRWLKDGTKHSEPMFMLDEVARLVKPRTPNVMSFNAYQPYQVPKEKIEFPPEGLEKALFELNEPGQVIVRSDRPKAIYYVFALVKRTVPSEYTFYREYASGPESLLGSMDRETDYQGEYRRALLGQLREQARLNIINRDLVEEKGRSDES